MMWTIFPFSSILCACRHLIFAFLELFILFILVLDLVIAENTTKYKILENNKKLEYIKNAKKRKILKVQKIEILKTPKKKKKNKKGPF